MSTSERVDNGAEKTPPPPPPVLPVLPWRTVTSSSCSCTAFAAAAPSCPCSATSSSLPTSTLMCLRFIDDDVDDEPVRAEGSGTELKASPCNCSVGRRKGWPEKAPPAPEAAAAEEGDDAAAVTSCTVSPAIGAGTDAYADADADVDAGVGWSTTTSNELFGIGTLSNAGRNEPRGTTGNVSISLTSSHADAAAPPPAVEKVVAPPAVRGDGFCAAADGGLKGGNANEGAKRRVGRGGKSACKGEGDCCTPVPPVAPFVEAPNNGEDALSLPAADDAMAAAWLLLAAEAGARTGGRLAINFAICCMVPPACSCFVMNGWSSICAAVGRSLGSFLKHAERNPRSSTEYLGCPDRRLTCAPSSSGGGARTICCMMSQKPKRDFEAEAEAKAEEVLAPPATVPAPLPRRGRLEEAEGGSAAFAAAGRDAEEDAEEATLSCGLGSPPAMTPKAAAPVPVPLRGRPRNAVGLGAGPAPCVCVEL